MPTKGARGVSTGRTTRQRVGSAAAGRPVDSGPEPPGQASCPWAHWGPLPKPHGWRGLRRRRAPGFYVQAVKFDTSSRSRCRALLLHRAMHLMPFVLRARDRPVRVCTCCRSPPFPRDIGEGDILMMWGPLCSHQWRSIVQHRSAALHRPARYCAPRQQSPRYGCAYLS